MLPIAGDQSGHLSVEARSLSVIVGLALAAVAAKPRPNLLLSLAALAAGSFLAYRGATGYCPISASLGEHKRLS